MQHRFAQQVAILTGQTRHFNRESNPIPRSQCKRIAKQYFALLCALLYEIQMRADKNKDRGVLLVGAGDKKREDGKSTHRKNKEEWKMVRGPT